MAEEIARRLRFSNADTEQVAALVANHLRFKDVPHMKPSTLKRFARLDRFDEHLELHRLDCMSSHRNLESYEFMRQFISNTPAGQVHPVRLLTGDDLINLGLRPSPSFKAILDAAEDAQLEGIICSHEQALKWCEAYLIAARAKSC
jgi:poly(A) polymerase